LSFCLELADPLFHRRPAIVPVLHEDKAKYDYGDKRHQQKADENPVSSNDHPTSIETRPYLKDNRKAFPGLPCADLVFLHPFGVLLR